MMVEIGKQLVFLHVYSSEWFLGSGANLLLHESSWKTPNYEKNLANQRVYNCKLSLFWWHINFLIFRSSGNAFVFGAGSLRFKSRAGQIENRADNDISSKGIVLLGRNNAEVGLANSLHALA